MRSPSTATKSSSCSLQLEKATQSKEDPAQPKINKYMKILKKKKQKQIAKALPQISDSVDLGQGLRVCLSHKFLDNAIVFG